VIVANRLDQVLSQQDLQFLKAAAHAGPGGKTRPSCLSDTTRIGKICD
jgi:hypothetical protein